MKISDNITTYYTITIFDKNNNIVNEITHESQSFVKNFSLLMGSVFDNQPRNIKNTSGGTTSANGIFLNITDENVKDCGILIGSNVTDVTPDDYTMSLIVDDVYHSDMMNQLTVTDSEPYYDSVRSTYKSNLIKRYFRNESLSNLEIYEFGVVVKSDDDNNYLIIRDIVESEFNDPIIVEPDYGFSISYTFATSNINTYNRNFHRMMYSLFNGGCEVDVKDYSGVISNESFEGHINIHAMDNEGFGILVGYEEAENLFSFDGYKMDTILPTQIGVGIIHYSGNTYCDVIISEDKYIYLRYRRSITNFTGYNLNIWEIGVFVNHNNKLFMILRSTLNESVALNSSTATGVLIETYTVI